MGELTFAGWSVYADAVVDVDLGDRTVTLGREGVILGAPWIPHRSVYVVTAHNPGHQVADRRNEAAQTRLRELLSAEGIGWLEAVGRSRDGSWQEASLAIEVPESEAIAIARRFDQDAIFGWDGVALRVIACDDANN